MINVGFIEDLNPAKGLYYSLKKTGYIVSTFALTRS